MTEVAAKEQVKALVARYEAETSSGKTKKYTEEDVKKGFILPLFEALGWDIAYRDEVSSEEHIKSSGRVDYGFYLNDRAQFYLEAKSFKAQIHEELHARQAIRYSWNKGVTWAVLTNFERILIFNTQDIKASLASKLLFDIPYNQYIERFDQLSLLSKQSLEEGLLDKYAEEHGKKLQRIPISSLLYNDLNECREMLTKSLAAWNKERIGSNKQLLDEGVQKLLDRLIFLRVAEDRGIEPPTLIPLLREWESRKDKNEVPLYKHMVDKFRELDKIYNSNLFTHHPFEDWEEYDGVTEKVVEILYGKPGYYEYDFKVMPADVLGTVYENYLGYKLSQSRKGVEVHKDAKKRKEQGIYYTPHFIVEYIVKNALGPVLDKCKTIEDLKKIKVLDPACGSGSFLVQALELIYQKYYSMGDRGALTKYIILTENIYGVDLDEQAVEIARLNLLVSALDGKIKLPLLDQNIKNGNSLISGTDDELKKYFGDNFREKKPFNWEEEFPNVFKQGGFDVIIGNPPYGAELSKEDQNFFKDKYDIGSTDTAILFIRKAIKNLKHDGSLGFIIPKAFCFASNYEKIRDFLWNNVNVIVDCGKVWKEVKLEQIIFIANKAAVHAKYQSIIIENDEIKIIGKINKEIAKEFGFFLNGVSDEEIAIAQKIKRNSVMLSSVAINQRGAMSQKEIRDVGDLEVLGGAQISREGVRAAKGRIDKSKIEDEKAFIKPNSILVQNIVAHIENPVDHIKIIAAIPPADRNRYIILDTVNQLAIIQRVPSFLVWIILNSTLINWYAYRFIFGKAIRTMHFDNTVTSRIPIPDFKAESIKDLNNLADKLISLQNQLRDAEENSNEWGRLKSEIEKTDKKINEAVYKLYGLTDEEIKIIEAN
jgi:type I restriction-modification system DNA methylase subunit